MPRSRWGEGAGIGYTGTFMAQARSLALTVVLRPRYLHVALAIASR